jgi:cysteinyl-tRNA synthetase
VPHKLRIFNTLTRQVEDFKPQIPGKASIYTCGPTVYSYAHIGNMRQYIFADSLRRSFEYFGYDVKHVMNITDVGHLTDDGDAGEDKLEVGARREGVTAWDVAARYTQAFFEHAAMLNIKRPHIVCKATDYIAEQIHMVEALERRGFTYTTEDGVYFDTARFPDYTKLARLDVKGLQEGHRVDLGAKRSKTDFALWKFSKPGERRAMEWESPWARGFPGWHIECSAMSVKLLGEQFDIHTGGVDHIPIHHTNEIAQTECATGRSPFVKVWMHGEFLVLDDEKMSKSLGNVLTVQTLKDKGFDPLAFRMLVLQSHYRKQLRFNYDNLVGAAKGLERVRVSTHKLSDEAQGAAHAGPLSKRGEEHKKAFDDALAADLNMPQAIAQAFSLIDDQAVPPAEKLHLLWIFDEVFGIGMFKAPSAGAEAPQELQDMLAARNQARADKNWADADRLRKEITARGYDICDGEGGSSLKKRL